MDDVSLKLEKFFTSYTLDMKLLMEKTTENCILNESYLRYGDEIFRKEDILPPSITPSMIYHKKSISTVIQTPLTTTTTPNDSIPTPNTATSGQQQDLSRVRSQQSSSFRSQLRRAQQQHMEAESAAYDETLQLRRLKDEKHHIEEKIRKTMDNMNQRSKVALKNRFLFDIIDDDDGAGSYDYEETPPVSLSFGKAGHLITKSCVSSLRNEPIGGSEREKSQSDGLIRLVDRRRRKNKFFMRKYLLNTIKFKISPGKVRDVRLKRFRSDNDVWMNNEINRSILNTMASNITQMNEEEDDLFVIRAKPRRLRFDKNQEEEEEEEEIKETRSAVVYFTPSSADPSLATSTCLDINNDKQDEDKQQQRPKLQPMTTGYFSLELDPAKLIDDDDKTSGKSDEKKTSSDEQQTPIN